MHLCPMQTVVGPATVPHVGGPIIPPGVPNVTICKLPAAVVGSQALCTGAPPGVLDAIVQGSATVKIGGRPAARMGDGTAHGGKVSAGAPTVEIGG
jgi:uncharacterized Zn-binding protein involved in type VI secretion